MSTAPTPEFTDFRFHASGTYGDVYEATEVELHRKVAIKVIQVEMAHLTTAKAHGVVLAKLSHDNIVKVFRLTKVTLPGGREPVDALVMEWLTAATLSEKLRDGGMTLGEVLNIGNGVLRGLRHMHGKDVFNGDLNVGNVLIGDEFVKIIDVRATDDGSVLNLERGCETGGRYRGTGWIRQHDALSMQCRHEFFARRKGAAFQCEEPG